MNACRALPHPADRTRLASRHKQRDTADRLVRESVVDAADERPLTRFEAWTRRIRILLAEAVIAARPHTPLVAQADPPPTAPSALAPPPSISFAIAYSSCSGTSSPFTEMLSPARLRPLRAAAQSDQTIHHADVLRIREQQRLRACKREVLAIELRQRLDLIRLIVPVTQPFTTGPQILLILAQRRRALVLTLKSRADAVQRPGNGALVSREVRQVGERRRRRRFGDGDRRQCQWR